MTKVHEMIANGKTYPSDITQLTDMTKLESNGVDNIHGIIAPYGNYRLAGKCYQEAYSQVVGQKYDSVIIISPIPKTVFLSIALSTYDEFQSPVGNFKVDKEANEFLHNFRTEFIIYNDLFHDKISSVEEQLPFIASSIGTDTKIVPIILGEPNTKFTIMLAKALQELIEAGKKNGKKYLIVATTNLSENCKYEQAQKQDELFAKYLTDMKPDPFSEQLALGTIQAYGGGGVTVLLRLAELINLPPISILKMYNTADNSDEKLRTTGYIAASL